METLAIKQAFGEYAYSIPISSTKSQLGHLVCAAGGIEIILSVMALKNHILPPTINLDFPDPACDLQLYPPSAAPADARIAMSNSFGFGGQNGTIVLRRYDGGCVQ